MVSSDDARLIAAEPALPGMRLLLDDDAFAAALRARARTHIVDVRANYVRYKHHTSCLVGYEIRTVAGLVHAYAIARHVNDGAKLAKRAKVAVNSPLFDRGEFVLRNHRVVVRVFPNDAEIVALRMLADPARRGALELKLVPELSPDAPRSLTTLAYKPERRYVARLQAGESSYLIKAYSKSGHDAARRSARALAGIHGLLIPKLISSSRSRGAISFQWLSGQPLWPLVGRDPPMERVGAALAQLHKQGGDGLRRIRTDAQVRQVRAAAMSVATIAPHLAGRASQLAEALVLHLAEDATKGTVHGDFYAQQVLIRDDGSIALIDLDEAGRGPCAMDLGNFLAHLTTSQVRGELPATSVESLRESLLSGYATNAGAMPDHRHVELYTAVGLLKLASAPFRSRHPRWLRLMEATLDRAESFLESESGKIQDPLTCLLRLAIDPSRVEPHLNKARISAARVIRQKPGRRALVEYDVEPQGTIIGKIRAKGVDRKTYKFQQSLWEQGFNGTSANCVSVPQPVGIVPELHMWLQKKVAGSPIIELLQGPDALAVADRIGDAERAINECGVQPSRRHTIDDELRILRDRLDVACELRPDLAERIRNVMEHCVQLAVLLKPSTPRPIHRDFYHDQLLVDSSGRLWLLDLDLFCEGTAELDIGNFCAHLTEYSLRHHGHPLAFAAVEERLRRQFDRWTVDVYTLLSLARLIHISMQFADRAACIERLLGECEHRCRSLACDGALSSS
jgi:Ser/Thr protein kinase RdoA (MazF antagonist)